MIVDANVLVSAAIGNSLGLVVNLAQDGHDLIVPSEQFREAESNGLRLAGERGFDGSLLIGAVLDLVQPIDTGVYAQFEPSARARLDKAPKAQRDWPLLALALATGDAIWTNDGDLSGTGVMIWKTTNIRFVPTAIPSSELN